MIYLLRKHDIISVPFIREAYIFCEADIILKIYHPFQKERISLKKDQVNDLVFLLAGVDGFEPPTVGVRVQCLTAWRYPNEQSYYTLKNRFVKRISQFFSV